MTETPRKKGCRLMGSGYAQVLRVIADGGATWQTVSERCNVGKISAQTICHGFRKQGITHIAAWTQVQLVRRAWAPVYAIGPGVDAPCPGRNVGSKSITLSELRAFCDLVKALQRDAWHFKSLSEYLGQAEQPVRKTVRLMHTLRLVRIDDYLHRGHAGLGPALWTWGPDSKDAKKPPPATLAQLWQRHNAARTARRREAALLRAMVHGVPIDGRRRVAQDASA